MAAGVTILESLKSVNAYPIPASVIMAAAINNGVDVNGELTKEAAHSKEVTLCRAELLEWLAGAPNISQGGQSYSFSPEQRKEFKQEAQSIRQKFGDEDAGVIYGYKGTRL